MTDSANNEVLIDLFAGWASGGATSVFCSQPIDTVLTRKQAGSAVKKSTKSLVGSYGLQSLWRGSTAMIGAIPFQNGMLMAGYGIGKRFSEEHRPDQVLLGAFIGGCTGGIVQSFLMSPVELVKVNQQVGGKSLSSAAALVSSNLLSKNVGWKGLEATLLRDGIPHGVWFASYEYCKRTLEKMDQFDAKENSAFITLFSGSFAATAAWGVGYPFDIIKTRIQASSEAKSVVQATMEIIQESNGRTLPALYKGFSLKLAKAVPASAVNFFVYESVAERMRGNN